MNNDMNLTRHKVYKEGTEGGRSRTNIKDMQTKFIHASKCGKNGKRLSWESERAEILFAVILAMYKKKKLPLLILHLLQGESTKIKNLGSIG